MAPVKTALSMYCVQQSVLRFWVRRVYTGFWSREINMNFKKKKYFYDEVMLDANRIFVVIKMSCKNIICLLHV